MHQQHLAPDDFEELPRTVDTDDSVEEVAPSQSLAELSASGAEATAARAQLSPLPGAPRTSMAVTDTGAAIAEEVPFSAMASFLDLSNVLSDSSQVARTDGERIRLPKDELRETPKERQEHQRMRVAALLATLVGAAVILRFHSPAVMVPRFAVELLGLLALCAAAYTGYLYVAFGVGVALPFAYCVAIELLFGFDNAMDIVGWYMHSGIETGDMVRLILAGGVIQGVPRLTVLPVLAHSLSHSPVAQHCAAVLLMLTAARNIFVGLTLREPEKAGQEQKGPVVRAVLPLAVRIVLVELTDFFANADSFLAKALATDDELHISLSSLVTLFVPRALALLLLAHHAQQQPRAAPMKVMLLVSGFMLLALASHIIVPAVPDLPNSFKLIMPAALYGYVFYLAVGILARSERPAEQAA